MRVLKEAGTHTLGTYIDNQKAIVAEWVALMLKLEVCIRDMGYEGEGRRREAWWQQTAYRKQLGCGVKKHFGGGKSAVLGIRQAW